MRPPRLRTRASVLAMFAVGWLGFASPHSARAQATLENPQSVSFQSGIGVVSGWVCNATLIEIIFNDSVTLQAAYGTNREDTVGVWRCG